MYSIPQTPTPYLLKLHYAEGSSDKIYEVEIVEVDGQWETRARWGRRGSAMQSAVKTKHLVDFRTAARLADDLARQKTAKGYEVIDERTGDPGAAPRPRPAPPATPPAPKRHEVPMPQLATAASASMIDMLVADENYVAQEKYFGERRLIVKEGDSVCGYNRRRTPVEVSAPISEAACQPAVSFTIDGEIIGDQIFAFDLLSLKGADLTRLPLDYRLAQLYMLSLDFGPAITPVYTARTTAEKRKLFDDVRARDGEGLVFKKQHGLYVPGRPAGEPGWLKHKFHDMLSAIVIGHNQQRSVALGLADDDGRQLPVGNVTIPINHDMPPLGAVVEIRYLFAYENGSLYEPVYLGQRTDICTDECLASQRKFKPPVAA